MAGPRRPAFHSGTCQWRVPIQWSWRRSSWCSTNVDALITGLIGVAAALLGSFTTYLFQSRSAERARAFERQERRRQEQLDACGAFAAAVTELKKAFVDVWFYSRDASESEAAKAAGAEADRLSASTQIARFRVQLVSGDPELMALADEAFKASGALLRGPDRAEMRALEARFEQTLKTFIQSASERLG